MTTTLRAPSDHRRVERVSAQTPTPTPSRHKRARFPCKRREQAASAGRPTSSEVRCVTDRTGGSEGCDRRGGGHTRWPPHSWRRPPCSLPAHQSLAGPAQQPLWNDWHGPAPDAQKDTVSKTAGGPPRQTRGYARRGRPLYQQHTCLLFLPPRTQPNSGAERCPLPRAGRTCCDLSGAGDAGREGSRLGR